MDEKLNARLVLEEAVSLPQGASAEVYNNLGVIYHVAGDFSGAEIQFRKALARWPDMVGAHINLANALKAQQRFQEARTSLGKAQTLDPSNATVAYTLGILLMDGTFPSLNDIERFNLSIEHMEDYKSRSTDLAKDDPVHAYIEEAKKRIKLAQDAAKEAAQESKEPDDDFEDDNDEASDDNPADASENDDASSGDEESEPPSNGEDLGNETAPSEVNSEDEPEDTGGQTP